jgi:hypothetical protein
LAGAIDYQASQLRGRVEARDDAYAGDFNPANYMRGFSWNQTANDDGG